MPRSEHLDAGSLSEEQRVAFYEHRGQDWINADQLKGIHREIAEASRVHDPKNLPE